jgi:hypothetical protein
LLRKTPRGGWQGEAGLRFALGWGGLLRKTPRESGCVLFIFAFFAKRIKIIIPIVRKVVNRTGTGFARKDFPISRAVCEACNEGRDGCLLSFDFSQ